MLSEVAKRLGPDVYQTFTEAAVSTNGSNISMRKRRNVTRDARLRGDENDRDL